MLVYEAEVEAGAEAETVAGASELLPKVWMRTPTGQHTLQVINVYQRELINL